jgi:hypothetical protein
MKMLQEIAEIKRQEKADWGIWFRITKF